MIKKTHCIGPRLVLLIGFLFVFSLPVNLAAKTMTCPPFYLRTEQGGMINPLTGQNVNEPYSTRQTCGECHDYEKITKGYHFQMGWDRIDDKFSQAKPWSLSDGTMGKQ